MTKDDRQTGPVPSEQRRGQLAELSRRNNELEKLNQALIGERETLKKNLDDCARLLKASTTGLISLDKSGLIDGINPRALDMLGAEQSYLLKKPISLFIAQEDQALFFINRSRIVAGAQKKPFEIKLKTGDGTTCLARVTAQPFETPNQQLPGMLLALVIVTILGPGLTNVMVAVGIAFTPSFMRVARGSVLATRENAVPCIRSAL